MKERVFVGLGANLGDPRRAIEAAAAAMRGWEDLRAVRLSALWRTSPVGPAQPWFVNAVAELEPTGAIDPVALLARLLDLERRLGRERSAEQRHGPRILDLDLLLVGERVVELPGPPRVILPHPEVHRRAFALAPLVGLAGEDLVIPGHGPAGALLAKALAAGDQRLEPIL